MKTTQTILLSLATLALIGCGDSGASTSQPLQSSTRVVHYLTDLEGMSLYTFDNDAVNLSNCDSECQKIWPLFIGMDNGSEDIQPLSTNQLAYRQHPLYYFINDNQAGDVNGDNVKEVWHLIYSSSNPDESQTKLSNETMVQTYLSDHNGVALYVFDNDEANLSNCYGACEDTWPIYYNENIASLPTGINRADFGSITRDAQQSTTGVLQQSTYKGKPLYYFTPDNNEAGATKGDWVKGVWHLIELNATKS